MLQLKQTHDEYCEKRNDIQQFINHQGIKVSIKL